jgi:hypothetical protein
MTQIFREILHKTVECYVDDLAVKSRKRVDHLADLRKVFLRLRQHNLKMNPIKCFFGVLSGKFLGFIVRKKGIKVYPAKTKDILGMPSPTNIKELRGFHPRTAGPYNQVYRQYIRQVPTLFSSNEKRGGVCLRPSMPRCIRKHKRIPDSAAGISGPCTGTTIFIVHLRSRPLTSSIEKQARSSLSVLRGPLLLK